MRLISRSVLVAVTVCVLGTCAAAADTYYVDGTCGDDAWTGTSPVCQAPDGPKATIQAGINAAGPGDVVVLATGTYTGDGNRDCDFLGKAITVRSLDPDDPGIVAATVIDCQGVYEEPHRAFSFITGEGRDSILAGVTVINGRAPYDYYVAQYDVYVPYGGAVTCFQTSPTISGCVFTHNKALSGGAIFIEGGHPLIVECQFVDDQVGTVIIGGHAFAGIGGALNCDLGNVDVVGCSFTLNRAFKGGAISLWNCPSVMIADSTMRENTAGKIGAGIACDGTTQLVLTNCDIVSNSCTDSSYTYGGGISAGDPLTGSGGSTITAMHCRMNGNSAGAGGYGGAVYFRHAELALSNCEIIGNQASRGGAVAVGGACPRLDADNCTLVANAAPAGWPALEGFATTTTLTNCVIWGATQQMPSGYQQYVTMTYCNTRGGWPDTGNIDADPLFVDPDGPDNDPTTWEDNDYRLGAGSPCIDAGNNAAVPPDVLTDLDGLPRFVDGNGDLIATVDMGAYENQDVPPTCPGDGNCDGVITWRDVDYFVAAMNDNLAAWQAMFAPGGPTCPFANNDVNADGTVSWRDIDPLVGVMNTGCP